MGNPRWSTTQCQVVHNKVADRPQAKANIQVIGNFRREFRQGQVTFGPTEDVTRMMRHASPICIQSTWGTGGPQLSVRWSTTKWSDLRQNQTFKSWATLQGISAGPNNVWPYRRCHPNNETYKASPICIQSTWGTPGGPQLSVRWSTTKWLTDLRQNANIQVMGNFRREFRQGQTTFGPTEDVTRMTRHTKHLLFVFNQHGEPQVVHNSVSGGPQQSG